METEIPRSWAPGGKQAHGPVLVVVGGLHGNEPSGVIALTRPRAHQVRHRHPIQPRYQFRMEPDLVNFQSVRKNQLLASDQNGEIRSPRPGRILMPLYQAQGDDGFFIVDPIEKTPADSTAF